MRILILARSLLLPLVAASFFLAPAASAVTIDWVTVCDPSNTADTTGFGAVAESYRMSKTEVTNAQYAEFLNAKAASDPLALYNTSMASGLGGITRGGSAGSYTYGAISGREAMPVNYVSFYDSLRFSNWLNNGQGGGDTETGAYALLADRTLGVMETLVEASYSPAGRADPPRTSLTSPGPTEDRLVAEPGAGGESAMISMSQSESRSHARIAGRDRATDRERSLEPSGQRQDLGPRRDGAGAAIPA